MAELTAEVVIAPIGAAGTLAMSWRFLFGELHRRSIIKRLGNNVPEFNSACDHQTYDAAASSAPSQVSSKL